MEPNPKVFVSHPTWENHINIFKSSGLEVEAYPYWDPVNKNVDFESMKEFLLHIAQQSGNKMSIILLHACAHNPTGMDLTEKQLIELVTDVFLPHRDRLYPLVDNAYQGYASGCVEKDAFLIRLLYSQPQLEFAVCQSFAKNMGLYGERMGMLHIVCPSDDQAKKALSQLKLIIRTMYSSPPIHGGKIVQRILSNPHNYQSWTDELLQISKRIRRVREMLVEGLLARCTPGTWTHITDQIGMFSFTGLDPDQCDRMINKHHIYMLKNGRISLAGLNESNIDYVADAIDECVRHKLN